MNQPTPIAGIYSPPFRVVSKYFLSSIVAFVLFNFLLLINFRDISGHHFQPKILSLTHIATLGFITMVIFGAMYQLVPVVLEVKLFSTLIAEIQFWIYLSGVVLLVYKFWFFSSSIPFLLPGMILNLAIILFSLNIVLSMIKVKKWNITGTYISAALFWLLITALAGYLLTKNLDKPFFKINHLQYLKLHAITAFVGWVGMIIMGVSFKLIPMFTLSHDYSLTPAKISFVLINTGLLGVNWIMHYPETGYYNIIFGFLIFLGMFLYLYEILTIFNKRIRKKLDIGLKFTALSFIIMGILTILNFSFLFFNYEEIKNLTLAYGLLVFIGAFGLLIVGQMYKIVPFLVWYHKYSSKVGLESVPMLKDMFSEKIAHYNFYTLIAGLVGALTGLLTEINVIIVSGFILLFISSLFFSYNMYTIFRR